MFTPLLFDLSLSNPIMKQQSGHCQPIALLGATLDSLAGPISKVLLKNELYEECGSISYVFTVNPYAWHSELLLRLFRDFTDISRRERVLE
jgi:hypothetical protein